MGDNKCGFIPDGTYYLAAHVSRGLRLFEAPSCWVWGFGPRQAVLTKGIGGCLKQLMEVPGVETGFRRPPCFLFGFSLSSGLGAVAAYLGA